MSLEKGLDWSFKDYHFTGYSIAGQSTSLVFNNAKICFDIAQGLPFHFASRLFCITHLHADHGAGLNYLLSQRSLFRLPCANIMLPVDNIEQVDRILQEWQGIEGFQYDYKLIPVEEGVEYELNDQYWVRAFKTVHRVNSFGYLVYERKKKLKAEYKDLPSPQIIEKRKQGIVVEETVSHPLFAFTGDSQIEFIRSLPDVMNVELLFIECTYLDERKTIDQTRFWGHIHLDEILANLDKFHNEHLCLIHLSARYSTQEALKILNEKLPTEWKQKISLFPRPF